MNQKVFDTTYLGGLQYEQAEKYCLIRISIRYTVRQKGMIDYQTFKEISIVTVVSLFFIYFNHVLFSDDAPLQRGNLV